MFALLEVAVFGGGIVLLFIFISLYKNWLRGDATRRLPPGPKPALFLGNVHQLSADGALQKIFMKWGAHYGGLIYARFFRTPVIVINSLEIAQDLLTKKSAIYSGRPYFVSWSELMGWDTVVSNMTYGVRFRKHRKWMHESLQERRSLLSYHSIQHRETHILLTGLMDTPHDFLAHLQRFAAALIMEVAYGHTVTSSDDKFIDIVETALRMTSEAGLPGSLLVDYFPVLKYVPDWMPGAGFKRKALEVKIHVEQLLNAPFDMVKNALAAGTARPSMAATLLEQASRVGGIVDDEEDIKGAAAVLYSGSVSVLSTFILAMVIHPEVYQKAQRELDAVIGVDRLPDFDDRESLPYLEHVMSEVYRWNTPLPLGIPHSVMEDDEYRGYHIPNGATVMANIYAMSRNPTFYPDAERFRPERFEEMDRNTLEALDPRRFVFGFGRRACPGQQFAEANLWLAIAHMTATLDIKKARDAAGNGVTPAAAFSADADCHPEPFVCDIRPRSRKAADLVSQIFVAA
ncbi:cytochrome P450 monooxygenase [Amylocystis lapponica]|nr:cytochrome P450 monooxygenase [Amylocystis lapponica]